MSSSAPSESGSLRPMWSRSSGSGGRGFQPPPPVPAERRTRSVSQGSAGSNDPPKSTATNKFAALDDDEDELPLGRSPPFRSTSFGHPKSPAGPKGRSLADLASSAPDPVSIGRAHSTGYRSIVLRSESNPEPTNVIRFTREKLLALRPRPDPNADGPPAILRHLEDNPILSQQPLDPVCWDTFDADEIWALAARERATRSSSLLVPKPTGQIPKGIDEPSDFSSTGITRKTSGPLGAGKWQRGVALPPPDENHRRGSRPDSDNPNDLWDDPLAATDAALDFSAFGEIPDDPKIECDVFDFDKMTEATKAFEEELRGEKSDTDADTEGDDTGDPLLHTVIVNPLRPLATVGTTIRSGSGDNVNVFEDFDDAPDPTSGKIPDENPSASSRLMKMIGVNQEETSLVKPSAGLEEPASLLANLNPWAAGEKTSTLSEDASAPQVSSNIPSNPWGDSILVPGIQKQQQIDGYDLAARLQQEQQAREEMIRRQNIQDTETRRRQADEARRQQMEALARQQAAQQGVVHSEIELVLMERISIILENSWGRSDLISILASLHAEDSRLIPLLGNVDALRALMARHPRRIAIRQDPAFGAEMAVLLMTNAQFQQQQQKQQDAQVRAQQEQMQRREQQLRVQASQGAHNGSRGGVPRIMTDAPWFYSDPQKNIQGPFRGDEMRQWLEAGYFKGDLPISQEPSGPFHPLSSWFQDLSEAFRVADSSTEAEAELAAAREAELQQRAKEAAERREAARREAMRRDNEERAARMAAEAQKAAVIRAQEENKSSAQLKMMLGLGVVRKEDDVVVDEAPMAFLNSNKTNQQRSQLLSSSPAVSSSALTSAPKPAWGSSPPQVPKKSMSEIQQEEARQAALTALERGRASSTGWANVAASRGGVSGWQGGAVLPTHTAVATVPNTLNSMRPHVGSKPSPTPRQVSAPSTVLIKQQQQQQSAHTDAQADNFGATMSPVLESWCKAQMTKINGSDDLTLVSFCMTLTDPSEIRQYLTAYLGTSAQVNSFASEFINKRGLGRTLQEEWEDTKPKKTRKKGGK